MLDTMLALATELTRTGHDDRIYARILEGVRNVVPADASCLLRFEDGALRPMAQNGLDARVMSRRFALADHPRLAALYAVPGPLRFPPDDPRPDPFDGLVEGARAGRTDVHSCMGCRLEVEGEIVGLLTVDALRPNAFDQVRDDAVAMFAALAATTIRLARLLESLTGELDQCKTVARSLTREALARNGGEVLGTSLPMQHLRREVLAVARSGVTALIQGETGTGKELVARTIHAESDRADHPLVYVNCAALPEALAESEFFGHVRGAFTGAQVNRAGKFELAHNGILFLDEVGELPLTVQPKLLRALQEGELQRVGADRTRRVDVRIIAATNRNLQEEVGAGRFRADLYHRLSVYPITVPPLRSRGDDVVLLASAFLERARRHLGMRRARFTDGAIRALCTYDWPGNVRELQHVVMRAAIRGRSEVVRDETEVGAAELDLPGTMPGPALSVPFPPPTATLDEGRVEFHDAVDSYQRELIRTAVDRCAGNWAAAGRTLGLDRSNLHRMARRLGLK